MFRLRFHLVFYGLSEWLFKNQKPNSMGYPVGYSREEKKAQASGVKDRVGKLVVIPRLPMPRHG
jgi:hypothetical protein